MRLCLTLFLALILPAAAALGANDFSRKQVPGTTVSPAAGRSVAGMDDPAGNRKGCGDLIGNRSPAKK